MLDNGTRALLRLEADDPRIFELTPNGVLDAFKRVGVPSSDALKTAIKSGYAEYKANPDAGIAIALTSTAPVDGVDGGIEWDPGVQRMAQNPLKLLEAARDDGESPFVMIQEGQTLGGIRLATLGRDGMDLAGQVLPGSDGRPINFEGNPSVTITSERKCVANRSGSIYQHDNILAVHPYRRIDGDVDGSTGDIDHDGDLEIMGAVCDGVSVRATGHLCIHGFIGRSILRSGGNLFAVSGLSNEDEAVSIDVAGNVYTYHIANTTGKVHRSLWATSSMRDCRLSVGGELTVGGPLVGGNVAIAGTARIDQLGSRDRTRTTLILGCMPKADMLMEFNHEISRLELVIQEAAEKLRNVRAGYGKKKLTHEQREELTILMCEPALAKKDHTVLKEKRDALETLLTSRRKVDLRIRESMHPGVVLLVGQMTATMEYDVKKSVRLTWNGSDMLYLVNPENPNDREPIDRVANFTNSDMHLREELSSTESEAWERDKLGESDAFMEEELPEREYENLEEEEDLPTLEEIDELLAELPDYDDIDIDDDEDDEFDDMDLDEGDPRPI